MTVLFDGVASGMLLFLISVGLSVTLGLMNFVNLAHGAFAMLGGYVCVLLLNRLGVPFLVTLPIVVLVCAGVGVLLERTLYRRLYGASHLDQVLFSIGLVFMSISTAHYFFGAQQQPLQLPGFLRGQFNLPGLDIGIYRLFLIVVGLAVAAGLQWMLTRTRFGAELRASVDNRRAARGLGINVDRVFSLAFALGSALAGLGGALGVETLGLDPEFPVKYIVYFLIVVAVGGSGNILGSLYASLILGITDVVGKYYLPQVGRVLHLRGDGGDPHLPAAGPVRTRSGQMNATSVVRSLRTPPRTASTSVRSRRDARWQPAEFVFWLLPVLAWFVFPENLSLLTQIAIIALFALSLDLILGYAGIVSLGHAAFFGLGAYAAGLLAKYGFGDPLLGLAAAVALAAAAGFVTSFLVLRGADLTRLMVTLGVSLMLYEIANKLTDLTGGVDGLQGVEVKPLLGLFPFDIYGRTGYIYCVVVLFILFWVARHLVHSPFGLELRGIRQNAPRMPALGAPVNRRLVADLHDRRRLCRRGRRAAHADHAVRLDRRALAFRAPPSCC